MLNSISFERCPASTSRRILTYIIVQQNLDVGVLPCTLKPDFNTFASQYPRVQNIFNVSVFVSVPHKILIKLQILEIGSGSEAVRRLKEKGIRISNPIIYFELCPSLNRLIDFIEFVIKGV